MTKANDSVLKKQNEVHNHNTRNKDKFTIDSHRTELFAKLPTQ